MRLDRDSDSARSSARGVCWLMAWLLLVAVALPGCGGCRQDAKKLSESKAREELARKRKEQLEKQKPKEDYQFLHLNTLPHPIERVERAVKPGHWSQATLEAIANNFDFRGQVEMAPIDLDEMPFRQGATRAAVLPKAQRREFNVTFFMPAELNARTTSAVLHSARGREVFRESFTFVRMPAHQFYLVALARAPERYNYLRTLASVEAPSGGLVTPGIDNHYRVLLPQLKNRAPLSDSALTWTTVAYLIWDDVDPSIFSNEQELALVDWLHWGGQLIISGPGSLAQLQDSFLAPYLPATSVGTVELTQDDLKPINVTWPAPRALSPVKPWSAENLTVAPAASVSLGTAQRPLVATRRVGRGSITLTAFSLAQQELIEWAEFDDFFNSALLHRPPRMFVDHEESVAIRWADRARLHNPRRVSQVRYFSRDAGEPRRWHQFGTDSGDTEMSPFEDPDPDDVSAFADPNRYGPGVAGWDDFGAVSSAARDALREASGIKIPAPSFVLSALGIYLFVLIPANWGLFSLLGRVEWAWIAAPIISLAAAVLVVRAAQLDIGFVRATNELNIVELQGASDRAHVTRFAALYTSLSTGYDVELSDPHGLAQPFPDGTGLLRGQDRAAVNLARGKHATLEDFRVSSNTIGLVHAEHMLPLGGGVIWEAGDNAGSGTVTNRTGLTVHDARIVANYGTAWLGDLPPGVQREAKFVAIDDAAPPPSSRSFAPGEVNLEPLLALAAQDVEPGERRLIGWSDDPTPGLTIRPTSSQARHTSVIVAHLNYGPLAAPAADAVPYFKLKEQLSMMGRKLSDRDVEPAAQP